ncbi:MAG: N-acetylmuramoyl-L-alanine amidase [Owenweeksia sp.]|nr:N-acetylmuramoyl-L-alanine amidase [Owenweeksia sp.]
MQPGFELELFYRIQSDEKWTNWRPFHQNNHGATPDRTAFEADPIFKDFSKIQFKASRPVKNTVNFRLFFPTSSQAAIKLGNPESSACNCNLPVFCGRSCWCQSGSCTTGYTPTPTQPTHIIVHHSAGFNSSNDYKAVVAYYWDLHVNTNGWDDIGYNWLIDPNGQIYEGRGSGVTGAHFSCMNSHTTGICLIGNFQNTSPTVQAKNALKELSAWESCDKGIEVTDSSVHSSSQLLSSHISGHRDANPANTGCPNNTLCPGNFLYPQLPAIAMDIASSPCFQAVGLEVKTARKYFCISQSCEGCTRRLNRPQLLKT